MPPGLMIALFIIVVVAIIIVSAIQSAKRKKELLAWARSKGLQFSPAKDYGMDKRYPAFKHLRQGDNRYALNTMRGEWQGRALFAFDYHYETHSHSSKGGRQTHHHYFSAVIVGSNLALKPLYIRPEHFFDKVTEFFGADDIDFESAEFSKKFFVKSPDRKWAYDVIHARTMQFLLDSPQFTIQFGPLNVIAYGSGKFKPEQFEQAVNVIAGIIDRFPDYLVKQIEEGG